MAQSVANMRNLGISQADTSPKKDALQQYVISLIRFDPKKYDYNSIRPEARRSLPDSWSRNAEIPEYLPLGEELKSQFDINLDANGTPNTTDRTQLPAHQQILPTDESWFRKQLINVIHVSQGLMISDVAEKFVTAKNRGSDTQGRIAQSTKELTAQSTIVHQSLTKKTLLPWVLWTISNYANFQKIKWTTQKERLKFWRKMRNADPSVVVWWLQPICMTVNLELIFGKHNHPDEATRAFLKDLKEFFEGYFIMAADAVYLSCVDHDPLTPNAVSFKGDATMMSGTYLPVKLVLTNNIKLR